MAGFPPAAAAAAPAPADAQPGQGSKPYDLHKCAMDAYQATEKLATELGQAGAPPQIVKAVSASADQFNKLARSFAQLDLQKSNSPAGQAGPPVQGSAPRETMASATDSLAQSARRPA